MIAGGSNGNGRKFKAPPFPKQDADSAPPRADDPARRNAEALAQRNRGAVQPIELLDRKPPQDLFAEKALLGSILIDGDRWDDVSLLVRQSDFYGPANAHIFEAMRLIADDGKRPDILLLQARLKKMGLLGDVGMDYLAEVIECVPTSHNAAHYAELVANAASARALIHLGTEMVRNGYDPSIEIRERMAQAESELFAVFEKRASGGPRPLADVLIEAMAEIDKRAQRQCSTGLKTGFPALDSATGGFREGELTILAARPGFGKSALAANIVEHVLLELRRSVLFVSLEMSEIEISERMACSRARVNSRDSKNGTISPDERRRLVQAVNELATPGLWLDAAPGRNMTEIASMARRAKRRSDMALLVIDYLQLVEPDNPRDIREQQVAQISKRLKRLAREVKAPILCLAQINRESEKSEEPQLRHLRESGSIEQDADNVWMLHQLEDGKIPEEGQKDFRAKLLLRKQRGGEKTQILLNWRPVWTRFECPEMQTEF